MKSSEVAQAIGSLEAQVKCLCEHIENADHTYDDRHKAICSRLGELELSNQFKKGRMEWVGYVASIVALAVTGALGALINQVIGDLS